MSNYRAAAFNPKTGRIENADYVDNWFGHHCYGVKFDDDQVLHPHECDFWAAATRIESQAAEIADLRAALHYSERRASGKRQCHEH